MQTPSDESIPKPPISPEYLPFKNAPFRMAMGLQELDLHDWIQIDEHFSEEMSLKRALIAGRHAEVFQALPGSEEASLECLDLLTEHLLCRFPQWYAREGNGLHVRLTGEITQTNGVEIHPLDLAARLVQEDLCLMQLNAHGTYRLTAAAVCFPSRWKIAEKLGQSMRHIHQPVAMYDRELGEKADRFLESLSADRPVWRLNWNIHDSSELFQPSGHGLTEPDPTISKLNAGERLWLRVERQTLRRVPRTRAVLFTIRTYLRSLATLKNRPQVCAELAGALRHLPKEMFLYKSQGTFAAAALAWLDSLHS